MLTLQAESVIYGNLRVARSVPAEYSVNAYAVDILHPGQEYFYVYEREELKRDNLDWKEITKYTFFESGKDWVKVQIEIPGLGNVAQDNIQVDFGIRSLEVRIIGLAGLNYKLRVPYTHHPYNPEKSKFLAKGDKLTVSLFKRKQDDNWFTLQKQAMIGETLDDK